MIPLTLKQRLAPRSPDSSIAFPDDDPAFLHPFSEDLPETIRQIGVKIGPDVLFEMRGILEREGGALYQHIGPLPFINLFEGALEGVGLLEMKRLVVQIEQRLRLLKLNWLGRAAAILGFVQKQMTYEHDIEGEGFIEYGRFPLQTLADGRGDCECLALLVVALLSYLGYDTALILLGPAEGEDAGHAIPALKPKDVSIPFWVTLCPKTNAARYLWGEATAGPAEWRSPEQEELRRVEKVYNIPSFSLVDPGI